MLWLGITYLTCAAVVLDANVGLVLRSRKVAGAAGVQSMAWTLSASDNWQSAAVALRPVA